MDEFPLYPEDFMKNEEGRYGAFKNGNGCFYVLDQLKLPHTTEFITITNISEAVDVIKNMQVRGAPLIATVGLKIILIELGSLFQSDHSTHELDEDSFMQKVIEFTTRLKASRPTAINLSNAMEMVKKAAEQPGKPLEKWSAIQRRIHSFCEHEKQANLQLLWNGYNKILSQSSDSTKKFKIMTICNTGSLATVNWGTALGVIRALHAHNRLEEVFALETRPYNQGIRLTASELKYGNVPFKLIVDSSAAWTMKKEKIDAVIVGADQIAMNGDTANKIGTYMLALLAKHHGIPFYVAAPFETFNLNRVTGDDITIEERPADELLTVNGQYVGLPGTPVWNPAFDVTPGSLITAFITEIVNFSPDEIESTLRTYEKARKDIL